MPKEKLYKVQFLENFLSRKENIDTHAADKLRENYGSIGSRYYLWKETVVLAFDNNKWLGNGISNYKLITGYKYPHNIFLDYLFSLGIIGLFFLLSYLFLFFLRISKYNLNEYRNLRYLLGGALVFWIVLCFSGGLTGRIFYTTIGYMHFILIYIQLNKMHQENKLIF